MKVAVAINKSDDTIYNHFGHCQWFKIYNIDNDRNISSEYIEAIEDHGSQKFKVMLDEAVDVVIANGIGPGVMRMFDMTEMQVFAGVTGKADQAFENFFSGNLVHNPSAIKCCGRD